ncbi:hypothetical protein TNCV_3649491 [Trichonephila clavipes]|nr:hypothetical protein TNCV_3649491 [Trichonephila clavipes]
MWDPQVLAVRSFDPRGLPGRSRPGFPRVGTFSCPLLPTISNGTLRTTHLASNTARRPACSFHLDDQASLKLALLGSTAQSGPWSSQEAFPGQPSSC